MFPNGAYPPGTVSPADYLVKEPLPMEKSTDAAHQPATDPGEAMVMQPLPASTLQRTNLADQLYELLEKRILSGEIEPGTKLSEENVAVACGVSRSPAREAITRLERIGLATRAGARDRMVATPTEEMIRDIFEVWWILDAGRTYLASLNAAPTTHRRLYELLNRMETESGNQDSNELTAVSQEFHALLKSGCSNQILTCIIRDYGKYIEWFTHLYHEHPDPSETSRTEHRQIVDAFVRKDLSALTELIRKHILRHRDLIVERFVRARGDGGSMEDDA